MNNPELPPMESEVEVMMTMRVTGISTNPGGISVSGWVKTDENGKEVWCSVPLVCCERVDRTKEYAS